MPGSGTKKKKKVKAPTTPSIQTQVVDNTVVPTPWAQLSALEQTERLRAILFEVLTRTNLTTLKILL